MRLRRGCEAERVMLGQMVKQAAQYDDPIECVSCIDWSQIKIGRAEEELEQGRALAAGIFSHVDWHLSQTVIASVLGRILKVVPEDIKYQWVVQGFTDQLVHMLSQASKSKDM